MEFIKKSNDFFARPIPEEVRNPYIYNMKEAVELTKTYINEHPNCNVSIVGDYDSDGINATAILYWSFKKANIEPKLRLPRRFSEGYGLSEKIIDEIPDGLLITIDNGIAATKAIEKAKAKGLTVIVIDHHLPPVNKDGNVELPSADIIVDPHVYPEKSEFEDYCGAALAYRFALEMHPGMKFKQLATLASIATVSDVMPLVGANRTLVKDGLQYINKRLVVPGLQVLLNKLDMDDHITEGDYGFKLGPIFNASGRLYDDGAEQVMRLLISKREDPRMPFRADKLIETNEKRKEMVKESVQLANMIHDGSRPIVLFHPSFHEGIVGIIAGQLCEQYNCPTIVFTETENPDILKGSGRSIPEINLREVLDKIQDKIIAYGGHAGAAGLSVRKDKLSEFSRAFADAVGDLPNIDTSVSYYDEELNTAKLDEIYEKVSMYAPYGEANPQPVFHLVYTSKGKAKRIGDGTHFMLQDDVITIMGFGLADKYFDELKEPQALEMTGYLSESWFRGKKSYKFEIVSMDIPN